VASGGRYVKAEKPFGEKLVVDGKLITGQNPASAKAVGEAIIKGLNL
jgi:putative intracellular protease/amidase